MRCVNSSCREELETGIEFCPFCGADQPGAVQSDTQAAQAEGSWSGQTAMAPVATATTIRKQNSSTQAPSTKEVLEMRAGEKIWGFTEPEGEVRPGQRRALVIMDEQTVHLAHTDQHIAPEELQQRVQGILDGQQVPVALQLVGTRWVSDPRTIRPRLVAFLRDHPFSDIKMIMGVDYMGKWASIHLHLAAEPEPIPPPPPEPKVDPNYAPLIALAAGVLMLFMAFIAGSVVGGGTAALFGFIGMCLLIGGIIWFVVSSNQQSSQVTARRMQWQREQQMRAFERQAERISRTFKVDDMRLFCTAMRQVFQAVVDDIVQHGGEVVRVEGGKGGFFEAEAQTTPALRRTDAAAAGV